MNKTVLALAIFAFCLFPNVLSQNMRGSTDRELQEGIPLGNLNNFANLATLIEELIHERENNTVANTTRPAGSTPVVNPTTPTTPSTPAANNTTPTTPVVNPTTPTTPSTPAANNTTPSTPVVNPTTPTTPSTPVANNTRPTTPSTPAANNTTPTTPSTPAANNTTPSTPVANNTTPTTPAAPAAWYARNDVNMATFAAKSLVLHNIIRAQFNQSALTWSDSLAASAQSWANYMADNNVFEHSGRTGENIASTTASTKVVDYLFDLWTREQNWYIPGCTYPDCSSNGDEVGHFTQMVWGHTTQVGCGFAPGKNQQWNYLCCQYYRAGNVIGQKVF